ncbi:uncharacterized protein LOC119617890 [Kryptolebias marmoratus]|uniref:uncharacterized protein LOC119617890 n=1 Tax=Kryptolebias marmoratus TaxID=37003 RepID=UPI0018ACA4C9|nr:uncharacterized protein LOC119617890 [Kryptolebias marmoratus]
MDNWKIQLLVVTFCALVQIYQGLSFSEEERELPEDWQNDSGDRGLTNLAGLMKRSKALRFYGLMGKRAATKKPFQVNRRNKGEAFVGLMGRSISRGDALTGVVPSAASELQDSEEPYKQGMIGPV